MKKLLTICLLLTITFTSQAQDEKPTKEQTVEFIKGYLEGKNFKCDDFEDKTKTYKSSENKYVTIDFDETKSLLTIYLEHYGEYDNVSAHLKKSSTYKYKYVIDMSKIESINYIVFGLGKCEEFYLNFKVVPNANIFKFESEGTDTFPINNPTEEKEVNLPINSFTCVGGCPPAADFPENKKILQAFNHLRKLCGAPEPISFD